MTGSKSAAAYLSTGSAPAIGPGTCSHALGSAIVSADPSSNKGRPSSSSLSSPQANPSVLGRVADDSLLRGWSSFIQLSISGGRTKTFVAEESEADSVQVGFPRANAATFGSVKVVVNEEDAVPMVYAPQPRMHAFVAIAAVTIR
jgi:hypothetical protein